MHVVCRDYTIWERGGTITWVHEAQLINNSCCLFWINKPSIIVGKDVRVLRLHKPGGTLPIIAVCVWRRQRCGGPGFVRGVLCDSRTHAAMPDAVTLWETGA